MGREKEKKQLKIKSISSSVKHCGDNVMDGPSKGPADDLKEENTAFGEVLDFRKSLTAKDFHASIKTVLIIRVLA